MRISVSRAGDAGGTCAYMFAMSPMLPPGEEDTPETPESSEDNGGFDGGGVMGVSRHGKERVPAAAAMASREEDRPCKAFWVMGRKWTGQGEGGGKMLDSFLELKLENERLRQELRVSPVAVRCRDCPSDARIATPAGPANQAVQRPAKCRRWSTIHELCHERQLWRVPNGLGRRWIRWWRAERGL